MIFSRLVAFAVDSFADFLQYTVIKQISMAIVLEARILLTQDCSLRLHVLKVFSSKAFLLANISSVCRLLAQHQSTSLRNPREPLENLPVALFTLIAFWYFHLEFFDSKCSMCNCDPVSVVSCRIFKGYSSDSSIDGSICTEWMPSAPSIKKLLKFS